MYPKITVFLFLILLNTNASGQERRLVKKGNVLYNKKEYKEAEKEYQAAIQKNPKSATAHFNLGNTQAQLNKLDQARQSFTNTSKTATDPNLQANGHYNLGNTYLKEKKWQEAVDAYKNALRKNPLDVDAKYNLSYALKMLNQENKKKKDKKEDKKKEEQKKKKEEQKKENQNSKEEEKKHPEPQPSKLSEQQADNLLKALAQEEKKLQEGKQKAKAGTAKAQKDW